MSKPNETKVILEKALAELEKRGWCKHIQHNREGQMCALGAVGRAISDGRMYADMFVVEAIPAMSLLHKALPPKHQAQDDWYQDEAIADYNNRPGINFSHIRAWFKRAIEAAA